MSLYTLDDTTSGDGSALFFAKGPIFTDMVDAGKTLEKEKCVIVNRLPSLEFFAMWISSIKRYGQVRIEEWDVRPHIYIWNEDGRYLAEFSRGSAGGMVSAAKTGFYGSPSDLATLCILWLSDVPAFGAAAKNLLRSKSIEMRDNYQYAYKTILETLDHIIRDAKKTPIINYPYFFFHDLK